MSDKTAVAGWLMLQNPELPNGCEVTSLAMALAAAGYTRRDAALLGPAPASVAKVNNRYRYRLTLCCANSRPLRQLVAGQLRQFAKDSRSRGVTAFADVNPYL